MYKLFVVSCLIVAAFAKPAIIESGIPVVKTVVQQPGTVSVQQHTVESQHVHGIPTSASSQRQTVVQNSVSHLSPHVVGTQTVVGTPSIISSPTVLRTTSVVSPQTVVGTPSLVGNPTIVQSKPAIIESGIPVVKTVVQQPGTASVQQHTVESQHVHGIPTSVSSQRQTVVQNSVSHLSPHVVGTQTVVGTPSIISSPTVLRTTSVVSPQTVVGTPSLVGTPAIVQSKPAIIESGIPVVKTVVQQPGTVSVQQHTVESQHVHGIPTSVSSQRQTVVQKSVSHLSPHVVGTQTVVGTPSIISSPTVLRTPSVVSPQTVVGTPSLVGTPAIVQSYGTPISRTTVVQSQPTLVSHL